MAEHERTTQGKNEKVDQKHRARQQESQPVFDKSLAWDQGLVSLTETPFYPRMDEHVAILSRIPFSAQRQEFIMQLHQTYGNRYVQRLLNSKAVQAKLTVSAPNDVYEQEADRVADKVTRAIQTPVSRQEDEEELQMQIEEEELQTKPLLQRQEEEEEVQMQPEGSDPADVSADVESRINSARGGGQPLTENAKKPMEHVFGADFSGVRVHTDSEADALNQQLSAKAFTTGQDVFFRDGEYSPGSDSGRKLIAHELTHVVQQTGENKLQRQVPEWAKKEYKEESKRTVICSMTPDGKIGSMYFSDEGRIRTTHGRGPEKKQHQELTTVQFNIDHARAIAEFNIDDPDAIVNLTRKKYFKKYRRWLANRLKDSTVDNAPIWATKVEGPETAYDVSKSKPSKDLKLFEIFKNVNGEVEKWHPSRGAAVKFETDKQTISVLHAAIKHIDDMGLTDHGDRNMEFYQFVEARLPKFVKYMRRPDEINT